MNRHLRDPDEIVRLAKAALDTLMERAKKQGFREAIMELRSERFRKMTEAMNGDLSVEEIIKHLESLGRHE